MAPLPAMGSFAPPQAALVSPLPALSLPVVDSVAYRLRLVEVQDAVAVVVEKQQSKDV